MNWYNRIFGSSGYASPYVANVDRSSLGYDIVNQTDRRNQASPNIRSEDIELQQAQRQRLVAMANDSMRNFAICRWAVGKHLDFVARHSFSSQTQTSFDTLLQDRMERWMNEPDECDITGRHTFDRIVRMTEARSNLRGQVFKFHFWRRN